MASSPNLAAARRNARFEADSVFRRPQLTDLVLAFDERAAMLQAEAERQASMEPDLAKRSIAQGAAADFLRARQIAKAIREGELSGRDFEDAVVDFSNIMFEGRKGRPRWDVPVEMRPYSDDQLRAINATSRAEGLMGQRLPSQKHYKEARVAGGFGSAIAYRLAYLKDQIDQGVQIDSVVLLASSEPPPNDKTGFWLKDFAGDNYPQDAEMRARADEVDATWKIKTQFDVALATAYVILGEKFSYPAHNILQKPGGAYVKKESPGLGGAQLVVVGAFPSQGTTVHYADQNAVLEHVEYDKAQPGETLLHMGSSVYPWFKQQMLRVHSIRNGQKVESAAYGKLTPRLANRQPPSARALWEKFEADDDFEPAKDFIEAWHAAIDSGDTRRANQFRPIPGEYLQEVASSIREAHELNLDIDRFEREQEVDQAVTL